MSLKRPDSKPARGRPDTSGPDTSTFVRTIDAGLPALGVTLTDDDLAALTEHYVELHHWRRRADLTSLSGAREIAIRHFLDSLTLAPLLPRAARVADVGSGAGFPGIPLAVARPDLHVTLIEARELKVAFLHHVLSRLARPNLAVHRGRAGDTHATAGPPAFDAVVARAVTNPAETVEVAFPLLGARGQLWLMRSREPEGESFDALMQAGFRKVAEHTLTLPLEQAERRILVIERAAV